MKSLNYFNLMILLAFGSLFACVDEPASPDATVGDAVQIEETTEPIEGETVDVIAEESSISWVGRKVTGKHDGGFEDFDGTLTFAGEEPQSLDFEIDMNSTFSDNDRLTGHLKSGDFFLVEEYPTATFTSTSIESTGENTYDVTGNLELRGQTKSVTFPVTVDMSGDRIHATSEFTINRQDWGVSYAGAPDDLIKDEVEVMLDMVFPQPGMDEADASADDSADGEGSMSGETM